MRDPLDSAENILGIARIFRRIRPCLLLGVCLFLLILPRNAFSATQTWIGGDGSWGTGTNWTPNNWAAGNVALFGGTAGTVTVGAQTAGGLTFNVGGYTLDSGTLTLNSGSLITTNGGTTTFTSGLSLAGVAGVTLTKTGAGTLSLATNNTGLGTTASPAVWTVTGGTFSGGLFDSILSVGFGSSLGATPSSATTQLILDAGTLEVRSSGAPAVGSARTFQINAAGGAIRDSSGGSNTYQNNITNNAGGNSSLYLSNTAGTATFSGVISGGGSLTWNGAGTLSLTNTNTYGGGTVINLGSVSFTTNANLGANGGAVTLGGGTLAAATGANLSGNASNVFAHNVATGTIGGTIDVASGVVLGLNYYNQNSTGNISGSGPINKTGSGQLIVSGNNSAYSGNWTISGGILEDQYDGSTSLGSGSITLGSAAELALDYGNTVSNAITSSGGTLSFANFGGGTYSGVISLTSGTTTIGLRDFYNTANSENGSITGVISGAGGLITSGGGTLDPLGNQHL